MHIRDPLILIKNHFNMHGLWHLCINIKTFNVNVACNNNIGILLQTVVNEWISIILSIIIDGNYQVELKMCSVED